MTCPFISCAEVVCDYRGSGESQRNAINQNNRKALVNARLLN
jgi:hypothetical protein